MKNKTIEKLCQIFKSQGMRVNVVSLAELLVKNKIVALDLDIGDKVWLLNDNHYGEIDAIRVTPRAIYYEWTSYDYGYDETEVWDTGEFTADSIGKTVFLSLKEWEKHHPTEKGSVDNG